MNDDMMREYFRKREKILINSPKLIASLQDYNKIIDDEFYQNEILNIIKLSEEFNKETKNLLGKDGESYKNTIKTSGESVRNQIKFLKEALVSRYNYEIEKINNKVENIIALSDGRIEGFEIPDKFNRKNGILFNTKVDKFNFLELVSLNKELDEILDELNNEKNRDDAINLFLGSIVNIQGEIEKLKVNINNGLLNNKEISTELARLFSELKEKHLTANSDDNKLKLKDNEKVLFNNMISDVGTEIITLNLMLNSKKIGVPDTKNKYYVDLKEKIDKLDIYLEYYNKLILEPRENNLNIKDIDIIINALDEYNRELNTIRKQILVYYKGYMNEDRKVSFIDKVSFDNLNNTLDGIENNISVLKDKYGKLNTLGHEEVEKEDKVEELNESNLEEIKKEKIEDKKVHSVSEDSKKVRKVKLADSLYDKYEKACLLSAGLSFAALSDSKTGNVLMPAIMHGNDINKEKNSNNKGFFDGINNILGNIIDAKKIKDRWYLVNNIEINSSVANTSILKSIANHSSKSSNGVVKQLVSSTKNLIDKMKKIELKKNIKDKITDNSYLFVDPNVGTRRGR